MLPTLLLSLGLSLGDRLSGSAWRLRLNVGREPGSAMPPEWANSGARLAFSVDVRFSDERSQSAAAEPLIGPLDGTRNLQPLSDTASFVGTNGEVTVPIGAGAWRATQIDGPSTAELRCYLDFPEGAVRNEVELPAGRIFFTGAVVWDEKALLKAEAEAASLSQDLDALKAEALALADEASDSSSSPIAKAAAVRKGVLVQDKQRLKKAQLADAFRSLPDREGAQGSGTSTSSAALPGVVVGRAQRGCLSVKRRGGLFGLREVYNIIGRYELELLPEA